MPFTRRLLILLAALGLIGLPAVALRVFCVGNTCSDTSQAAARVPFCPLPAAIKQEIAAGYYAGTDLSPSPDVLMVTNRPTFAGSVGGPAPEVVPAWPAEDPMTDTHVPIVFSGQGVAPNVPVPSGTQLDAIAPSLAAILRYTRPDPRVRSGVAVPDIVGGPAPRLVLEVAWKGIGSQELRDHSKDWPYLRSLMRSGAGTLSGTTGSLPVDPAASLTTIGTGGPPSEHGVTGTLVRNHQGDVVPAWSKHAPPLVIATLADNLDAVSLNGGLDEKPLVGLVGTEVADQGLIGTGWFSPHDHDARTITKSSAEVAATTRMLATGFGKDPVPDVLGVVLRDSVKHMDASLHAIVDAATRASGGSVTVVVAGTGSAAAANAGAGGADPSSLISTVERDVKGSEPVVQAAAPGGLFLNQQTLASEGISEQTVVQALLGLRAQGGGPLRADAFPAFAISFAKYCP
jgi:hypothetical protein